MHGSECVHQISFHIYKYYGVYIIHLTVNDGMPTLADNVMNQGLSVPHVCQMSTRKQPRRAYICCHILTSNSVFIIFLLRIHQSRDIHTRILIFNSASATSFLASFYVQIMNYELLAVKKAIFNLR